MRQIVAVINSVVLTKRVDYTLGSDVNALIANAAITQAPMSNDAMLAASDDLSSSVTNVQIALAKASKMEATITNSPIDH